MVGEGDRLVAFPRSCLGQDHTREKNDPLAGWSCDLLGVTDGCAPTAGYAAQVPWRVGMALWLRPRLMRFSVRDP